MYICTYVYCTIYSRYSDLIRMKRDLTLGTERNGGTTRLRSRRCDIVLRLLSLTAQLLLSLFLPSCSTSKQRSFDCVSLVIAKDSSGEILIFFSSQYDSMSFSLIVCAVLSAQAPFASLGVINYDAVGIRDL